MVEIFRDLGRSSLVFFWVYDEYICLSHPSLFLGYFQLQEMIWKGQILGYVSGHGEKQWQPPKEKLCFWVWDVLGHWVIADYLQANHCRRKQNYKPVPPGKNGPQKPDSISPLTFSKTLLLCQTFRGEWNKFQRGKVLICFKACSSNPLMPFTLVKQPFRVNTINYVV